MRYDFWKTQREQAKTAYNGLKVLCGETLKDKPGLYIWKPRATNPCINYYFNNIEERAKFIKKVMKNYDDQQAQKAKWRAERKGSAELVAETVKVGDIFHFSWGYEQTNNDFYEVTKVKGYYITIQALAQKSSTKEGYSSMSDFREPIPGKYLDKKPLTKKVQFSGGKPYITMASYGWCSKWDGKPAYNSWYH